MAAETSRPRTAVSGRDDAETFVATFTGTMAELENVLDEETTHLAAGRIREGLSREERKSQLAAGYLLGLEHVKANAVALARLAPQGVIRLKQAQVDLRAAVERNQNVVATARAVSEGLVRSVADEVARQSRPRSYGSAPAVAAGARPLVYSARM